jgi:hypothetical protein
VGADALRPKTSDWWESSGSSQDFHDYHVPICSVDFDWVRWNVSHE